MKPAIESKTIIANLILAVIAFVDMTTGGNLAQWLIDLTGVESIELAVAALLNIALRFTTDKGISGVT